MPSIEQAIDDDLTLALDDLNRSKPFESGRLLVVGCSTSEVAGKRIGTSGSLEIAEIIYRVLLERVCRAGVRIAYQCCEHLNRALVIEQTEAERRGYEPVMVRPIVHAGGSMATWAYDHMQKPVVVESIKADYGIDIGDTLIGMHLRPVAVPVRSRAREIGRAHLTMANTRPKLIGGERAVYLKKENTRQL